MMPEASLVEIRGFAIEDLLGPLNEVERKFAPEKLFVAGDEGLLKSGRRVSIVGSRRATSDAIRRTRKLTRILVARGVTIVSGLAEGVDTAAHCAAIGCGGRTVAVLGTPVDRAYPKSNSELHREIVDSHVAVSQFPRGTPVRPRNFPLRNRTMALISDATVIVAAGERSGTIHQGWEALRLGRDLLLLESLAQSNIAWVRELTDYGAEVLGDSNLDYWLDSLPERAAVDAAELAL